jgi:hypothetical protein
MLDCRRHRIFCTECHALSFRATDLQQADVAVAIVLISRCRTVSGCRF